MKVSTSHVIFCSLLMFIHYNALVPAIAINYKQTYRQAAHFDAGDFENAFSLELN